ncbi:glycosyltransferase family 2 protein [uncultured Amnibacterium sp.]|uniref:glycosyltransferase family 2 protein n=1 Tax=uncultured Amnibacterium sp. TaxID=1631851 RepID=UPI0035CA0DBB
MIPTRNRPQQVLRAVRSALQQTSPPAEVVVVIDGPDAETARALQQVADPRLLVVPLERNGGPGQARNVGIAHSSSPWIALLDDDDEWLPTKLERQLQHIGQRPGGGARTVCATVAEWRIDGDVFLWPTRANRAGEPIGDYMFVRSAAGEGLLALPTLVVPRQLAVEHPFPEHLRTHEEWDWYLDLEAAGADWTVLMEPLAVVHAPRARESVSTASTWRDSLSWVVGRRDRLSLRAFSDFCLTEVARSARGSGDLRGVIVALVTAMRGRIAARSLIRFIAMALLPSALRYRLHARRSTRRPTPAAPTDRVARTGPASARRDA